MAARRKKKISTQKNFPVFFKTEALRQTWRDKAPILKYLAGFVVILSLFYALYVTSFFETNFLSPLVQLQSEISSFILNIFGMGTTSENSLLSGKGAVLNVAKGCDGIEAMVLYLAGVLLMPFAWRSKIVGLLLGAGVLFFLNLLRIIGLYLAKVYWPSAFEILHIHGGFALFTIVAILLWAGWANWAIRKEKSTPDAFA